MKVSVLVDNSSEKNFSCEHGLSLYIESGEKKIIFDLGQSDIFLDSLKKLNGKIEDVDYIFISHGHYDHMGGLLHLNHNLIREKVYISAYSIGTFYYKKFGVTKEISPSDLVISRAQMGHKVKNTRDVPVEIDENIYLLSVTKEKSKKNKFYKKYLDDMLVDDFVHEMFLIIREEGKYYIFTGCAHCNILEVIDRVKEVFNITEIEGVIGGLHTRSKIYNLGQSSEFAKSLKEKNVKQLILGHCTGKLFRSYLKIKLKNVQKLSAGKVFEI
ncbi:MAG: MBL fold metallo-hydrolase [Cetobacterium sp.]|uniref:MBL fold metallo-hydrolase n=1 Tax=Cetobacterium sp. TaxID=2071632 RepID=UPI003F2BA6CD